MKISTFKNQLLTSKVFFMCAALIIGGFLIVSSALATVKSVDVKNQNGTLTYGTAGSVTYNVEVSINSDSDTTVTPTISALPAGVDYTFNPPSQTIKKNQSKTFILTLSTTASANAVNSYEFTVTAATGKTDTGTLTINKATPTLSITNSPVTYNGSSQAAAVVGSVAGDVSNVEYNYGGHTGWLTTAPTNVGTYSVRADFTPTDTTNYASPTYASAGNFVINKADPMLLVTNSPVEYNGSPQVATVVAAGSISGSISKVKYNGSLTVPTDPGTYAITAKFRSDDNNYNDLPENTPVVGSFVINPDTTGPVISGTPSDIIVEATSSSGAIVSYTDPTANDAVDGSRPVSCLPASGSTFSLGTTTVTCSASDTHENTSTSTFDVTVQDTTAPVITITPGTDTVEVNTSFTDAGATWIDNYDGSGTIPSATSGSVDITKVGTYSLNYEYTDSNGNIGSEIRTVYVVEPESPTGTITVIKVVNPSKDSGKFNLLVNGETYKTNAKNGDSTKAIIVMAGDDNSVSEVAGDKATKLDDYTTSIECKNGPTVIASNSGETSLSGITVNYQDNIVCTITNNKVGSIKVTKFNDLNGNGIKDKGKKAKDEKGLKGFEMNVYEGSGCVGLLVVQGLTKRNGDVEFKNLVPGEYSVRETQKTGWVHTTTHCVNVTVEPGEKADVTFGNQLGEADEIAPTAYVTYSTTEPTNGDVIATIHPSEPVEVTNGYDVTYSDEDDTFTYTFTANGSVTFEFEDDSENPGSVTATVANIDREAPTVVSAIATAPTTVEITFDEELMNNEGEEDGHSPKIEDFCIYRGGLMIATVSEEEEQAPEYVSRCNRGDNPIEITGISYANKVVTLTLAEALNADDEATYEVLPEKEIVCDITPQTIVDLLGNKLSEILSGPIVYQVAPSGETNNESYSGLTGGSVAIYPCTDVVYSDWGVCVNGMQYRNILSQGPTFCNLTLAQQQSVSRSCGTANQGEVLGVKFYPDGSLLRNVVTKRIYVIIDGKKKYIRTLAELRQYYKGKPIIDVSEEVLAQYPDYLGDILGVKAYPDGSLLRSILNKKIYYIINAEKKHVKNLVELWKYRGIPIINVVEEILAQYPDAK